ncbi:MAG: ATP-binding protein [Pseudonocardiaceae bacterium]
MIPETAWQRLRDLDFCRVTEIPRNKTARDLTTGEHDSSARQRLAALVSAYHSQIPDGGVVAMGWRRASASGDVEVYVGGSSLLGFQDDGAAVLSLPAGGRGTRLATGTLIEALETLPCWTGITGIPDGLLVDDRPADERESLRPSLEDCLLGVWQQPFAWLVVAEPVSAEDIEEIAGEVADRQRRAQTKASTSPEYSVEAQRMERRHTELRRGASTGLWRVRMLAGGDRADAARRVAALVCASADLQRLPYALTPGTDVQRLATMLKIAPTDHAGEGPFYASSALLAAVARPPAQEIPGVRFTLRPTFDVTPETPDTAVSNVQLGQIMDRNRNPVGTLALARSSLNRHTFVCGATGAGKSQTVRGLLEAAAHEKLPFLVVEPAKAEYRFMAARLAGISDVVTIRPGEVDAMPAGINPLEPACDAEGRRFPLQTHADLVRALFLAAFEAEEPFPQVLSAALARSYTELGWDLAIGEPMTDGVTPRYPTLGDLQHCAEKIVTEIGYGKEITDNIRGFIRVRLSSLRLGTTGRFFEGGHQIDFGELLERNVVFEIEDVGDDRDKAFLMGTVLVRLVEHLRMEQRRTGGHAVALRHLSVFEEAHRLLRRSEGSGPAAHAVEMFAGLLAEIRAYGEGLIIAEQIPSKLVPDVIKNTAVKIVHRLPALDDRAAVGATMNITDAQSEYLVTLKPGSAAVFTDGMDYPLLVRMADGSAREQNTDHSPVTPAGLIAPRSATCGTDCRDTPCTLRQMRAAQRVLATDPRLVLWAELAVVAHLTGWTMPVPCQPLLNTVRALPPRTRDCALSHAVDAAVAARSAVTATRMSPHALAGHVIDAMGLLIEHEERHIADEPEWLATPYRWCLVWDALMTVERDNPTAGRHPRSDEWATRYGQTIPGVTNRDQLAEVRRWFDIDQRDRAACHAVTYGVETAPAIVTAIGGSREFPDWSERVAEQLAEFISCTWPLNYLVPGET